jgi:hypothetical protein
MHRRRRMPFTSTTECWVALQLKAATFVLVGGKRASIASASPSTVIIVASFWGDQNAGAGMGDASGS